MLAFLKEEGVCEFIERRLADRARTIKINEWVSDVEIEGIRRKISESECVARMHENSALLVNE